MTAVTTNMIPDGIASAPGMAFESDPTQGIFKRADGSIGFAVGGTEVGGIGANGVEAGIHVKELAFVEAGTGTYTGTMALPAGSRIIDIGVDGQVLWNSAGAVSLIVGDDADPDGFFTATDLKATDLLAGEINNLEHPGGKAGAYIISEQRKLYQATARNIVAVVTVASGTGTAGRTRVFVAYGVAIPVTVGVG